MAYNASIGLQALISSRGIGIAGDMAGPPHQSIVSVVAVVVHAWFAPVTTVGHAGLRLSYLFGDTVISSQAPRYSRGVVANPT